MFGFPSNKNLSMPIQLLKRPVLQFSIEHCCFQIQIQLQTLNSFGNLLIDCLRWGKQLKCKNFADVGIWTSDLQCQKQPLYWQSHNHSPTLTGRPKNMEFVMTGYISFREKQTCGTWVSNACRFSVHYPMVSLAWVCQELITSIDS